MKRLLLGAIVAIALCHQALAQCGPGGCSPCSPARLIVPAPEPVPEKHGWYPGENGWLLFFWRNSFCGWLRPTDGTWQTAGKASALDLVETFGLAERRKDAEKLTNLPREAHTTNFGMEWSGTQDGGAHASLSGKQVPIAVAMQALKRTGGGASDIPIDNTTPRITCLSKSQSTREKFLSDFERSGLKGAAIAAARDPDDWSITFPGGKPLYTLGASDPTLYFTSGDGAVWGHADGYSGPEDLAKLAAAAAKLRDKPAVDPANSPDLKKPPPTPPSPPAPAPGDDIPLDQVANYGSLAAALAAAAFVVRRRQSAG